MSANDIKVIFGGTLIDGTGAKPIENTVILIKGEKIDEITDVNSFSEPKETLYIFDARNKFISFTLNLFWNFSIFIFFVFYTFFS